MTNSLSNKCIFSGLPTENKWKDTYIHPDFIDLAREMVESKECPAQTMRQAFALLADQLSKSAKQYNQVNQENK